MSRYRVRIQRVYEEPSGDGGARVLVDRIWPRGLRKESAKLDDWAQDVAPSTDLRKWYGHDPARFAEFSRRYREELAGEHTAEALRRLRSMANTGRLTLLTATKDIDHSQAAVLKEML